MVREPASRVEGFEQDPLSTQSLTMPYVTGNGFEITGNGFPEITSSSLLPTGNLLFVRDGVQEITIRFPEGQAVGAFSFDYVTQEEWVLTFSNFSIRLPPARTGFVGVLFQKHLPTEFTLASSADVQGGLLLDNIRYAAPFMPSTPTSTITYTPTSTYTPEPDTP